MLDHLCSHLSDVVVVSNSDVELVSVTVSLSDVLVSVSVSLSDVLVVSVKLDVSVSEVDVDCGVIVTESVVRDLLWLVLVRVVFERLEVVWLCEVELVAVRCVTKSALVSQFCCISMSPLEAHA